MTTTINSFKTLNEVEAYRKKINEACDKRAKYITRVLEADELRKKSFSYLKEAFEAISPKLFQTSKGKKIMNQYTKTIRESKNLSAYHSLCENIRKANKNSDLDFFVNTIANENWNINKKQLAEDVAKLADIVAVGYILEGSKEELPKENPELISAINYIAENKKTAKNIAEYSDAVKVIRENVEKNEERTNVFENVNIDNLAQSLLEEFNKKYSENLNEEETKALKEICCSENREETFNKYKESCISKISEVKAKCDLKGDIASSQRLSTVMEQVSNKSYSLDTIGSDICNLIEISSIFD